MKLHRHPVSHHLATEADLGTVTLEKQGVRRYDWTDPYYLALTLSWPWFFFSLAVAYGLMNLFFAGLYVLQPGSLLNARPGSWTDAFFFSVQTMATVGYGSMVPTTLYSHVVATIEIVIGMTTTAIMTGLTFVRFSKPRAKILFAPKAVVAMFNGQPTLMIRLGNGRVSSLMDASARVTILLTEQGPDRQVYRRTHDLELVRENMTFFPLTWTLMHVLSHDSPLADLPRNPSLQSALRLSLTVTARDEMLNAQVYASKLYGPGEVVLGMRYVDAVIWDGQGRSVADMRKLGFIETDLSWPQS